MITCVTLAELSAGPLATDDEAERAARQARLQEAEAAFEPLAFDAPAPRAYGRVAASLRHAGRKPRPAPSTPSSPPPSSPNDLALCTCGPRGFEGIAGLTVVTIPHPDGAR